MISIILTTQAFSKHVEPFSEMNFLLMCWFAYYMTWGLQWLQLMPVLTFNIRKFYMYFITLTPNTMPRKVAMAIPKMPARMPGTTIELHPIAVAIPHAVVGPPTFAFDAKSKSFKSKRKSFPNPSITTRWTAICTRENIKILGAVIMTFRMLPLAPITTKNTCWSRKQVAKNKSLPEKFNHRSQKLMLLSEFWNPTKFVNSPALESKP